MHNVRHGCTFHVDDDHQSPDADTLLLLPQTFHDHEVGLLQIFRSVISRIEASAADDDHFAAVNVVTGYRQLHPKSRKISN